MPVMGLVVIMYELSSARKGNRDKNENNVRAGDLGNDERLRIKGITMETYRLKLCGVNGSSYEVSFVCYKCCIILIHCFI